MCVKCYRKIENANYTNKMKDNYKTNKINYQDKESRNLIILVEKLEYIILQQMGGIELHKF